MKVFKKIIWMFVVIFVWIILLFKWLSIKKAAKLYNKDKTLFSQEGRYSKVNSFLKMFLYAKQIKIEHSGKTKLDSKKLFFVSNHKSNLDAIVLLKSILSYDTPLPIFIAKIELATSKYAAFFDLLDVIYIDRENLRQMYSVIQEEINVLKDRNSIVVFPEGTRVKTDDFLDFKSAAFTPAYETLTAIQPVVIYNSTNLLHESAFKLNRTVYIKYLPTVQPLAFININKDIFARNLQANMYNEYLELKKEVENKNGKKSRK
ncbi:MAG: 1-acyl-sn-glycerol-3-phosphate acyltransferase [Ureaplasma sp.]|nr:1-acyl-sn-glycerol-3-phosphate acyltransferase [Ureaplasma sp.]